MLEIVAISTVKYYFIDMKCQLEIFTVVANASWGFMRPYETDIETEANKRSRIVHVMWHVSQKSGRAMES